MSGGVRCGRGALRGASFPARVALALTALVLLALAGAGSASAAVEVREVNFDDLTAGVRVTNQYETTGVVFGEATPYDFEVGSEPKNSVVSSKANCLGPITRESSATESTPLFASNYCGIEFGPAGTFAAMSSFAKEVTAYVGDASTAGVPFRLDAYGPDHHLIGHKEVTASAAAITTPITFVAPSYEIAYFALYRTEPDVQSFTVGFDSLSFKVGEAPPEITLSASASGPIAQGGTIKHTVTVLRDNGSKGNVRLQASGLPAGVTATFEPEVLKNTQSTSTLTLKAEDAAPLAEADGVIGAIPETSEAGATHSVPIHLGVVPPFEVYTGGASSVPAYTAVKLAPCSTARIAVRTILEAGFPGPVDLSVSNPAAGSDLPVTALEDTTLEPSDFDIAGVNEQRLTITRNANGPATGATDVQVVGTSGAFAEPPANVIVERVPPTISTITPLNGHTPKQLLGGTEVTLTGEGFCPGSTVEFGNPAATVQASSVSAGGTALKAAIPRLATSGAVTVASGGATQTAPSPMTIDSYRNVNGYQFHNYAPYVTFSQLTEAFGPEQTEIKIDFCWPFGCDISIPSPIALIVQAIADNGLNSGACFGMSLSSQRLLEGYKQLDELPPGNASDVFGLSEASGPTPALTNFINARHASQLSTEFISHFFGTEIEQGASGGVAMSKKVFDEIQEAFSRGEYPLVALEEGGRGHVVVAYDLEGAPGDYYIDVYDSNDPFGLNGSEEGEGNASHHEANVISSRVHVGSDGEWELPSTGIKGGVTGLVVTDPGTFPTRPSMIGGPGPIGYLFTSNSSGGASAPAASQVTQLEDASGRKLLGAGGQPNPNPATRPEAVQFGALVGAHAAATSAVASQSYLLAARAGVFTETVTGSASGNDTHTLLGNGFASQVGTDASDGVKDTLGFTPSSPRVSFATAAAHKPLSLALVKTTDGQAHSVQLATTSFRGGGDSLALSASGGALTFSHHGAATTFSLTLSAAGPNGAPATFSSGPIHVGRGGTATVSGIRWTSLASATLHMRVGRRSLALRNRSRGARLASVRALSARRSGVHGVALKISAALRRLPSGSSLAYSWLVRRGGRVIAHHAVVLSPVHRSATYTLKGLSRGSYTVIGTVAVVAHSGLTTQASLASRRLVFSVK